MDDYQILIMLVFSHKRLIPQGENRSIILLKSYTEKLKVKKKNRYAIRGVYANSIKAAPCTVSYPYSTLLEALSLKCLVTETGVALLSEIVANSTVTTQGPCEKC